MGRETPLSICERDFLLKCIAQKRRLDGRECYDYRHMKITFGVDRGCVTVQMGTTRVMCQVSCDVTTPKQTRPSEGVLFVNIELSPMAAPHFEAGRQSDEGVEITRILERCIKESRCVDTESLCIMSGLKVWAIRADLHVLDHGGNLIDCASIAAITGLAHFRRPDVTVEGEEYTIHAIEDRDPIPLSIHHMPICVTFAFYDQGKYLLVDPTEKEEKVMEGKMVIGMNKHREICTFQLTGSMLLMQDQVLRCSNIAVVKVQEITDLIQQALENDVKARQMGQKFGFAASLEMKKVTTNNLPGPTIEMSEVEDQIDQLLREGREASKMDFQEIDTEVKVVGKGTATIGEGGRNTWLEEEDEEDWTEEIQTKQSTSTVISTEGVLGSDSEEEATTVLGNDDLEFPTKRNTKMDISDIGIDLSKALKANKKDNKPKKKGKKKHIT